MTSLDWDEICVVFRKDLLEVLRDYRTLIVMILMPVIIYPALLVLPSSLAHHLQSDMRSKRYAVGLVGDYKSALKFFSETKTIAVTKTSEDAEPEKIVSAKLADIVVSFPKDFFRLIEGNLDTTPKVTIFYDARKDQNLMALTEVRGVLNHLRSAYVQKRLDALGVKAPQKYVVNFSDLKELGDQSLASEPVRNILPFLLFTMLTVSIIYPALDVITGERERNTLPLLLMSPTDRRSIMYGKFLVVCVMGAAALLIGLLSIFIFMQIGANSASDDFIVMRFPIQAVVMCGFVALPLVVILSSLSILLASWCKTFQQGQGYFVPFLFVAMGASSVCSLPGLKLSSGIALIPIVNIALSLKEVLSGQYDFIWLTVSLLVSIGFAVYVTYLASHILDSERLLFGVADSRLRRRISGDFCPEVGLLSLTVFLLMFYLGQTLQSWDIVVGSLITQVVVILLPAIVLLRHLKMPLVKTMSLERPRLLCLFGALLITPLCIVISMLVYKFQTAIAPAPEAFTTMFTRLIVDNGKPLWLCLLGIAIAPGICEELLFRGAILGLLRPRYKPILLCVLVGVLFGLFHMSVFRILPTAVLGMLLTGLAIWTGSIWPCMIVHIGNNSSAILLSKFGNEEMLLNWWPVPIVAGALGLYLLYHSRGSAQYQKPEKPEDEKI